VEHETGARIASRTVTLVSGHRMAEGGELYADLMFPSRLQAHFDEGIVAGTFDQGPAAQGSQSSPFAGAGLPHPRGSGLDEPGVEATGIGSHIALDEGDIAPVAGPLRPFVHEYLFRPRVAGDDHHAGGVSIQAMDDGSPRLRVLPPESLSDEVEEVLSPPSFGRDDGKALRLVEDDDVSVLVDHAGLPAKRRAMALLSSSMLHVDRLTM